MIYYADEKAMYWILDEFDKEQDIILGNGDERKVLLVNNYGNNIKNIGINSSCCF